jgi:hypothetical protein
LVIDIKDVHGPARLELFWWHDDAPREFIPPAAFTPPLG